MTASDARPPRCLHIYQDGTQCTRPRCSRRPGAAMTPRYCRPCDVYWTSPDPCWCCGHPGSDTRRDTPWDNPARSWRNPADWTPELEDA